VSVPREEEVRALVAEVVTRVAAGPPGEGGPREDPGSGGGEGGEAPVSLGDVAVGADHGGYRLKERIAQELRSHGFTVRDCGTAGTEPVDYPDFAHEVARTVAQGRCRWGIVVDGAGIGSCMVANKVPGVRAAACWDVTSARNSREHNHANVLTLGAGLVGEVLALQIVQAWLSTPWGGERHARRVEKIADIERRYLDGARP
jgi:ribose 5-phosphate isomerase B